MSAQLSLARPTRRRLVRLDRDTRDADLRIRGRVVLKVTEGMSCTAAARALGCAASTAARIAARFRRHGEAGLVDGRSDNGSRKVDADGCARIMALLEQRPTAHGFMRPTWTLARSPRLVTAGRPFVDRDSRISMVVATWSMR